MRLGKRAPYPLIIRLSKSEKKGLEIVCEKLYSISSITKPGTFIQGGKTFKN